MVLGAHLAGQNIVRDCMNDDVIQGFMNKTIYDEIIPTLTLPKEELEAFAASVTERFKNPFIDHALLAISLNSTSKWKARVMPSFKGYVEKYGTLPKCLTASFAFYAAFYRGVRMEENAMIGVRNQNEEYQIKDDQAVLDFFFSHKDDDAAAYAHAVCSNIDFWVEDLSLIDGFENTVADILKKIETDGAYAVMKECLA